MSTTTETPTIDELRARLAQEETEEEAAERELGAAALDGPKIKAVSKKLIDTQAAVQGTKAAIRELKRRQGRSPVEPRHLRVDRGIHVPGGDGG